MNRENYADYNFVMPTESSNFASIFTEKDENVNNLHSTDVGIAEVLAKYNGSHIDEDLLIFDNIGDVPMLNTPRHMNCILVGLCLSGKATYTVNTIRHDIGTNDVIIISEGQVTDNYRKSADFSGIAIMMSGDFFHEIIKGVHELSTLFIFSRSHPVFHINNENTASLLDYCKMLKKKTDDVDNHFRRDVVISLMTAMIYDLCDTIYKKHYLSTKKESRAERIFAKFIPLLEKNFRTERRVGWYAEQLCVTPKYFSMMVGLVSQRTPNEWIDDFVTLEIRVLLKSSTMSIKEIAELMKFSTQSSLGKYFKEHVGVSPSEYRHGNN